jgi:uncharacterized protein (TIGR02147 family)
MLKTDLSTSQTPSGPIAVLADGSMLHMPGVFDYQDYRAYLKDWLFWKKQVQPGYSAAIFARKAGIKAHTLLGMVIRGERNLSFDTIRHFGKGLGLTHAELTYFEKLVLFNQARGSEDKAHYFNQVFNAARGSAKQIHVLHDHAEYFSHWYVVAVRELVVLDGFDPDPEWICRKLKRKITRKQAQEAWETVLRLGLVDKLEPTAPGEPVRYALKNPLINVDSNHANFVLRKFHREFLKRADEAIDGEPIQERELSSDTLALSAEDAAALRQQIRDFSRRIHEMFPSSGAPKTELVALNMQLLSLTHDLTPKGEER